MNFGQRVIMTCVTCDKISLFAPKQGKTIPNFFGMQNIISFLYETKTQKNIKITNNIVPLHSTKMNKIVIEMAIIGSFIWFS
jgi:hypothetical protein